MLKRKREGCQGAQTTKRLDTPSPNYVKGVFLLTPNYNNEFSSKVAALCSDISSLCDFLQSNSLGDVSSVMRAVLENLRRAEGKVSGLLDLKSADLKTNLLTNALYQITEAQDALVKIQTSLKRYEDEDKDCSGGYGFYMSLDDEQPKDIHSDIQARAQKLQHHVKNIENCLQDMKKSNDQCGRDHASPSPKCD